MKKLYPSYIDLLNFGDPQHGLILGGVNKVVEWLSSLESSEIEFLSSQLTHELDLKQLEKRHLIATLLIIVRLKKIEFKGFVEKVLVSKHYDDEGIKHYANIANQKLLEINNTPNSSHKCNI